MNMDILTAVKQISLSHAILAAVVMILLGVFLFKSGFINMALWIGALVLLAIGAINKLSYGG